MNNGGVVVLVTVVVGGRWENVLAGFVEARRDNMGVAVAEENESVEADCFEFGWIFGLVTLGSEFKLVVEEVEEGLKDNRAVGVVV